MSNPLGLHQAQVIAIIIFIIIVVLAFKNKVGFIKKDDIGKNGEEVEEVNNG